MVGSGGGNNSRVWSSSGGSGGGSGGGTPTNPTPPDSMHSEDSSYVSAKETSSSQHSSVSALRVRFSPVAASFSGDGRTLMDIPVQGQSQDYTIPLKVIAVVLKKIVIKLIYYFCLTGCETSASRLPRVAIIQVNLERTGTRVLVMDALFASPNC